MSTISSLLEQSRYKGLKMADVSAWAPTRKKWLKRRRKLVAREIEWEQTSVETAEGLTSVLHWHEGHVRITLFAPIGYLADSYDLEATDAPA